MCASFSGVAAVASVDCLCCPAYRALILCVRRQSGGYSGGVPPLPIPNREVKPAIADGTAMQCGRVGSCLFSSVGLPGAVAPGEALFLCHAMNCHPCSEFFLFCSELSRGLHVLSCPVNRPVCSLSFLFRLFLSFFHSESLFHSSLLHIKRPCSFHA